MINKIDIYFVKLLKNQNMSQVKEKLQYLSTI